MLINHLFCSSRSKFGHRLDNHALRASPVVVSRIRHSWAQTRMLYLFLYCPILGRPTIVDVRIRSRIVRIHRTRRTIRVVRIVPTTDSRFSKPVFQPCSWQIQRSLSQWRTCLLHMDFYSNHLTFKAGVGLRKDRP